MKITEATSVILCSLKELVKSCETLFTKYAIQPFKSFFFNTSKPEEMPECMDTPTAIDEPAVAIEDAESSSQVYKEVETTHAALLKSEAVNEIKITCKGSFKNNNQIHDDNSNDVDSIIPSIESENVVYLSNKSAADRSSSVATDAIPNMKLSTSFSSLSLNEIDPVDPSLIEQSLMKILYKDVSPFNTEEQIAVGVSNNTTLEVDHLLKDTSTNFTKKNVLTENTNMNGEFKIKGKSNMDGSQTCQDKHSALKLPFDDMNFEIDTQYDLLNKNVFLAVAEPLYISSSNKNYEERRNEKQDLYENDIGMFEIIPFSSSDMEGDLTSKSDQLWTVKAESMFLQDENLNSDELIESHSTKLTQELPYSEKISELLYDDLEHGSTESDVNILTLGDTVPNLTQELPCVETLSELLYNPIEHENTKLDVFIQRTNDAEPELTNLEINFNKESLSTPSLDSYMSPTKTALSYLILGHVIYYIYLSIQWMLSSTARPLIFSALLFMFVFTRILKAETLQNYSTSQTVKFYLNLVTLGTHSEN
ncbi:hypothetical protein SPOG_01362 [Schizosaccharomyces cryophilus OY26]|uniref:Uncharacterized protein n=1 Tax=Schizosaccharomyces cryophilus (strain OY26 / ATCC MYA-4695 / CBS 11777 / NBRC 106824 / NRRL Y48691) TaxID=653667 RepID=S9X6S3_SCHCR|nr:uncharacterized protein SPOG_01362 [Schizosaccharomyces cryophilus OY26]EPY49476.1 hypothetical protein SPOG_01362 [Schizosaccharomyces cryophilus OY26]